MLTIILCLFPFALFSFLVINLYFLDDTQKKNK